MENAEGLRPEQVEAADFAIVRRGYEPEPVRRRLREAAAEIRRLNTVAAELSERLAGLEAASPDDLEAARIAEALGDEAVRVLQAARDAAQDRIERAEAESAEIVETARAAATAVAEEGRDQGRAAVQEAKAVRERLLTDLARRRRAQRIEVEQLRTVRDRLLESLSICQDGLAEWVEELVQVVPQARSAAQRAGLLIAAEPEPTAADIEAEIETGRLMGLPLDEASAEAELDDDSDEAGSVGLDDGPVEHEAGSPGHGEHGAFESEPGEAVLADADADADAHASDGDLDGDPHSEGLTGDAALAEDAEWDADADADAEWHEDAELSGVVEITPGPSPDSPRPGALYDMEAESSTLAGEERDEQAGYLTLAREEGDEDAESLALAGEDESVVLVGDDAGESEDEVTEPEASAEEGADESAAARSASGADAIFARLRAVGTASAGTAGTADQETPGEVSDPVPPEAEPSEEDEEVEPSDLSEAHGGAEADEDDLIGNARAVAVGEMARRLKRMVVDEQGELLDALRRTGPRALGTGVRTQPEHYAQAVRGPLEDFASDIDVSVDDIDLLAAGQAVVSTLVEPTLDLLQEIAEENDDIDQLSAAVRAVYRESRSRRADAAAEEAFAKGWPEPIA